jgi:hypothetical protein
MARSSEKAQRLRGTLGLFWTTWCYSPEDCTIMISALKFQLNSDKNSDTNTFH